MPLWAIVSSWFDYSCFLNSFLNCVSPQSSQAGPQPQNMFHTGGLSAPTPPNMQPGHSSPQASYAMQGYSLPTHQALPHGFPSISQLTQVSEREGLESVWGSQLSLYTF